jgi:hypothetical protein
LLIGIALIFFAPLLIEQVVFIQPEMYLTSVGYQGPIIVIYNQSDGQPIKYDGKARIYEVPENGIVLSQFSFSNHPVSPTFWYANNGLKIEQLPFYGSSECGREIVSDPVIVCPTGLLTGLPFDYVGYILGPSSKQDDLWDEFAELLSTIKISQ